jgi:hypothetical protein
MKPFFSSALVVAAVACVTSFAAGCAAHHADDSTSPPTDDNLTSAPLTQDLICAAVKAADDSNDGEKLKKMAESELKGAALADFKSFQKNELPDFPSQAFELPVKLAAKTFTFVMVIESNDGGQSIGVYKTDGTKVSEIFNGESEPGTWKAPADKCK